jgi:hypothetical protein
LCIGGITVSKDGQIMTDNLSDTIIDIADIEQNLLDNPHLLSFWSNGHKPTSTTSYIDSAIIDGELTLDMLQ